MLSSCHFFFETFWFVYIFFVSVDTGHPIWFPGVHRIPAPWMFPECLYEWHCDNWQCVDFAWQRSCANLAPLCPTSFMFYTVSLYSGWFSIDSFVCTSFIIKFFCTGNGQNAFDRQFDSVDNNVSTTVSGLQMIGHQAWDPPPCPLAASGASGLLPGGKWQIHILEMHFHYVIWQLNVWILSKSKIV